MALSIAVVGAGRIGSTFAYHLARAGHDVSAVARPGSARLEQLRRDQGIVLASGERAAVRVMDVLDESQPYDLVIVTTLAHQIAPLLPVLQRCAARAVQCMFVTIDPEPIRSTIGLARCTFGMPFATALLAADGKLASTVTSRQKTLHGDRRWAQRFNEAGIPSAFEPDMPRWLRSHAPLTIALESIAIYGKRRGSGASWGEALTVARGVRAGFTIVRALDNGLYPRSKALIAALPAIVLAASLWAASHVASFRELLATGLDECRALVDALAAAAENATPPLDAAATAVRKIKPVT